VHDYATGYFILSLSNKNAKKLFTYFIFVKKTALSHISSRSRPDHFSVSPTSALLFKS